MYRYSRSQKLISTKSQSILENYRSLRKKYLSKVPSVNNFMFYRTFVVLQQRYHCILTASSLRPASPIIIITIVPVSLDRLIFPYLNRNRPYTYIQKRIIIRVHFAIRNDQVVSRIWSGAVSRRTINAFFFQLPPPTPLKRRNRFIIGHLIYAYIFARRRRKMAYRLYAREKPENRAWNIKKKRGKSLIRWTKQNDKQQHVRMQNLKKCP